MRRELKSLHTLTASLKEITKGGPVLAIEAHDPIPGSDVYRIIASHNPGQFSEAEYDASLRRETDNKMRVVEASVRVVHDGYRPVVAFLAEPLLESKPYEDEKVKGMTVVTANVFSDEGDNMWKVVGEGKSRRLVQMSEDNLDDLLASRAARNNNVVHASYVPDLAIANGDYVFYFDQKDHEIRAGFALHTADKGTVVIERESGEMRPIVPFQVVEAFVGSALKNTETGEDHSLKIPSYKTTASFDGGMAKEYLDYARKLYGGTRFFSELEKWVGKKKAGGNEAINMRKD